MSTRWAFIGAIALFTLGCRPHGEQMVDFALALQERGDQIAAGQSDRAEVERTLGSGIDWILVWASREDVTSGTVRTLGLPDYVVETLRTFQGNPGDTSMIGYFQFGRKVMMTLPPAAGLPGQVHVLRGNRPMVIRAVLEKDDRGVRVAAFEAR